MLLTNSECLFLFSSAMGSTPRRRNTSFCYTSRLSEESHRPWFIALATNATACRRDVGLSSIFHHDPGSASNGIGEPGADNAYHSCPGAWRVQVPLGK